MIALLLSAALAAAPGPASAADERMLSPEQEVRVQKLAKELRCATCQGLSIADSPAAMARSQMAMVRELISEGKSDDEVRAYFVARYGEWVLLAPPAEGVAWLAWVLPVAFVLGGLGIVIRLATKKGSRPAPSASPPPRTTDEDEDEYLARVRREVEP